MTSTATDTLVRDFFPEDNQRHLLVYEDRQIQTLNEGVRMLYRVSNRMLRYRQLLSIRHLTSDRSYEGLIRHNAEMGTLSIRFPSESAGVSRLRNNRGCKMTVYYRDEKTGSVRELPLDARSFLDTRANLELVVYTNHHADLMVSFDVYLMKPRAAL